MPTDSEQIVSFATRAATFAALAKEAKEKGIGVDERLMVSDAATFAYSAVELMDKHPAAAAEAKKYMKDPEKFVAALKNAVQPTDSAIDALAEYKFQTDRNASTQLTEDLAERAMRMAGAKHFSAEDKRLLDFYAQQTKFANAGADPLVIDSLPQVKAVLDYANGKDKTLSTLAKQTPDQKMFDAYKDPGASRLSLELALLKNAVSAQPITQDNQKPAVTHALRDIGSKLNISGIAKDSDAPLSKDQIEKIQSQLHVSKTGSFEEASVQAAEKVFALQTPKSPPKDTGFQLKKGQGLIS